MLTCPRLSPLSSLLQVASHLSSVPTLYVHDGAVGSSSSSDARCRVIAESRAAAAALAAILAPTPTRDLSATSFPVTLYAAPSYSNKDLGKGGFIAADFKTSHVIAAGSAVGDAAALKAVLAAAAAAPIAARGALSLPGRLVSSGKGHFLLVTPSSAGTSLLVKSSVWSDPGVIWSKSGAARLFPLAFSAPNLYTPPSALVLVTSDSTGGLPPVLKLTPQQAAFYFLVGYDGSSYHPAFSHSAFALGGADPVKLAQTMADLVSSTGVPAYLINAHNQDAGNLALSAASGSAPESKPASEDAATQLKSKLEEYAKSTYPTLPEDMTP
jgi:hypothetical protein